MHGVFDLCEKSGSKFLQPHAEVPSVSFAENQNICSVTEQMNLCIVIDNFRKSSWVGSQL